MARDRSKSAFKVRRGDVVSTKGGREEEVKAVRDGRYDSGGPVVVLVFKSGRRMRVHAAEQVRVVPGGGGGQ
ncbi:hypothetical protein [Streptantibioticus ferralitis]|uniref:DUF1918 domain-containing protein n=1 Tax=Streptantibioticus ferralitis TaxID=236510 RepID=A0ABT5Z5D3_9ACTN|nr:hypothetical protein [Streptantibioticus ferralitis]MDF2259041.1 hypothetical protein [Streptantibioticus ferralitis]